jgi:Phosphotransferase enzyme family
VAVGAGGRVVRVRPLASGWLANHAVDVADAAGGVHRLVLRRWARPGWEVDDPTLTAAREAAVLELLAATPVPAPRLVAADPDGAACDVPALLLTRLPGRPPDPAADPRRLVGGLAAALPPIDAIDAGAEVAAGPPRRASGASSTATTTRATPFLVHQRLSALMGGTERSCATWASTWVRRRCRSRAPGWGCRGGLRAGRALHAPGCRHGLAGSSPHQPP